MKFDKRCKPWLLTTDADYIYDLRFVWLEGDYLVAMNAHALVAIPVQSRTARDVDGLIPTDALKAAVDVANGEFAEVVCLKTKVKAAGQEYSRPKATDKPDWRNTMKPFRGEPPFRIAVNAGLLKRMAHAMGEAGYTVPMALDIYGDSTQLLARSASKSSVPGVIGLVMPMRVQKLPELPKSLMPPKKAKKS